MTLPRSSVGQFLRTQAEELTRIWRAARIGGYPEVLPGVVDGVVTSFFTRAGELLERGALPEEVWPGLVGTVRQSLALPPDTASQEWSVLADVLTAACESVGATRDVAEWLASAAAACAAGTASVAGGSAAPGGILVAHVYSAPAHRHRSATATS